MDNQVLEVNVGGTVFTTTKAVLTKEKGSLLYEWFHNDTIDGRLPRDAQDRRFIDRDGTLFRYILDALRNGVTDHAATRVTVPDDFQDYERLRNELDYYRLGRLACSPSVPDGGSSSGQQRPARLPPSPSNGSQQPPGFITLGYHGTFSFGRQGITADINFRKITRILVCGKVSLCRAVFGETINEGRDPDRGEHDRYTARFFLKHSSLEQAFDQLAAGGFRMVASCGTGTNGVPSDLILGGGQAGKLHTNNASEEDRWAHYNEYVFCRPLAPPY